MITSLGRMFSWFSSPSKGREITFHPSQTCPECGSRLCAKEGIQERVWLCPNPDCPVQIRARVEHWCSPGAMDIPGGDTAFVGVLVGRGLVRDVAELYHLKLHEIVVLPSMDKDSAQKFFDAITASMKRDAWRVLFGLSIPQLGADEAKSLCQHFPTLDHVFGVSAEQLLKADDIGEVAAQSVVYWYGDSVNRKIVKRLFKAGVNFKSQL